MTACATLSRLESGALRPSPAVGPVVLVDGRPRTDLWVRTLTMSGRLDQRQVELGLERSAAGFDASERARVDRLIDAAVTILQPIALTGGDSRLLPLLDGRIVEASSELDPNTDELTLTGQCNWSDILNRPIETGELDAPQWTLQSALEQLNALAGLDLELDLLAPSSLAQPIRRSLMQGKTVRSVLEAVLNDADVVVHRSLGWAGHRVSEQRTVRPGGWGRPVRLGLSALANPSGAVASIHAALPRQRPVKLTAEADGQVVESTFELVGGWDPAGEGEADNEYVRSLSSDFDAVANVYRLWVLNEDGSYSDAPFNRGPAFDLTGLFADGRAVAPQPLRFGNCLAEDAAGRSVGVVIEVSTDGGSTWAHYAGQADVMNDRAAVYLSDDALPSAFFAAAKTGQARVRATATLRSPLPVSDIRWHGSPFAGPFEHVRLTVGNAFAHRRVDATSKFYSAVQSGGRTADEADDRDAMEVWLAERAQQIQPAEGAVSIVTTSPALSLRIGDRLERIAGRNLGADLADPAAAAPRATLDAIEHRWTDASSMLTWRLT